MATPSGLKNVQLNFVHALPVEAGRDTDFLDSDIGVTLDFHRREDFCPWREASAQLSNGIESYTTFLASSLLGMLHLRLLMMAISCAKNQYEPLCRAEPRELSYSYNQLRSSSFVLISCLIVYDSLPLEGGVHWQACLFGLGCKRISLPRGRHDFLSIAPRYIEPSIPSAFRGTKSHQRTGVPSPAPLEEMIKYVQLEKEIDKISEKPRKHWFLSSHKSTKQNT